MVRASTVVTAASMAMLSCASTRLFGNDFLKGYQLYGFFDKGEVWSFNNDSQILSLLSVGAGVRFFFADQWQAGLGVAFPVHIGTTASDVNAVRFLFSLSKIFHICPQRVRTGCL